MEIKSFNLKPCPFCGSEVSLKISPLSKDYPDVNDYEISCKKCGCTLWGANCDTLNHTDEEAVEKVVNVWNRRAEKENGSN